jgi:hypothetical protein
MRNRRCVLLVIAAGLLVSVGLSAVSADEGADAKLFVPVDELERGDRCVGLTVFEGTEIQEFPIEIVDVVRGVAPGSDLIIGRAEGEILEKTGILEGMSGSPVYRDGRLIGAIASTWQFTKEPMAGITPIGEMLPALSALDSTGAGRERFGAASATALDLMPHAERGRSGLAVTVGALMAVDAAAAPATDAAVPTSDAGHLEGPYGMAPIAAPLVVSGADDAYLAAISGPLSRSNLAPVRGSSGDAGLGAAELRPGAVVGAQFVRGDVSWTAIGTVTYTDGDRVLAFGHPLFGAGEIEMPMVAGYVHALMPLQSVSFKYASGGELVGTLLEDRSRMVAGVIGRDPAMLPVSVHVDGGRFGDSDYRFEVVRARPMASYFTGLAAGGAVSSASRSSGPAVVELSVRLETGQGPIHYEDVFRTASPAQRAAGELALLLSIMEQNAFADPMLDSVRVDVGVRDEDDWAVLDRVEADKTVVRPGDELGLTLFLRHARGDVEERELRLRVPKTAGNGRLIVRAGDSAAFHEWEAERLGPGLAPRSYEQLVGLVERSKPGNAVVAQLLSEEPGFSLMGNEVRGAPGRAGLAMTRGAASGAVDPASLSVVDEMEMRIGLPVYGRHEFVVEIRSQR